MPNVRAKYDADLAWITQRIHEKGLGAHAARLLALARPGITIRTRIAAPSEIEVGASRIGGDPDVPLTFEWPEGGEGMLFLAQLRLAELSPMDPRDLLPKGGLLSIFVDQDVDVLRIFHFAEAEPLARRSGGAKPFRACLALCEPSLHLPPPSSHFVGVDSPASHPDSANRMESVIVLPPAAFERYWDQVYLAFVDRLEGDRGAGARPVHQVLGYAHGLDDTGGQAESEEVLFAFDTDDNAKMEWGDCQRPVIFMNRDDLVARRFDKTRVTT